MILKLKVSSVFCSNVMQNPDVQILFHNAKLRNVAMEMAMALLNTLL